MVANHNLQTVAYLTMNFSATCIVVLSPNFIILTWSSAQPNLNDIFLGHGPQSNVRQVSSGGMMAQRWQVAAGNLTGI